jgi:hypothetical protein
MYLYYPAQDGQAASTSTGYMYPTGRTIPDGNEFDVVQANSKLYIFRGSVTDSPRYFSSISKPNGSGIVSCTTTTAHGLSVGDEVIVYSTTGHTLPHAPLLGSFIVATAPTTTTLTYDCGNTGAALSHTDGNIVKGKPPLVWDGSSSTLTVINETSVAGATAVMPCGDFGLYFQNRMVVACTRPYTVVGVEKWIKDTLAVSDILDYEVFDMTLNQFILNQGGNDSIVGVLPWVENQFIVFMKRSVWLVYIEPSYTTSSAPGANSSATLISSEIGCIARRSITSAGQFIFFLSHKGVHLLTPQLDLKLLGNTLPLSEPVDDIIQSINWSVVSGVSAEYNNNRFYIALPINGATRNNAILVYNTLNQNWESVDVYPDPLYLDGIASLPYGDERKLYIFSKFNATPSGGLYVTEANPDGDEEGYSGAVVLPFPLPSVLTSTPITSGIEAFIRTREYTFGTMDEKYWLRANAQFNCTENDQVTITSICHDPDSTADVLDYTFTTSVDGTLRPRVAARGASMQVEVNFAVGRPALKSISGTARLANRSMDNAE